MRIGLYNESLRGIWDEFVLSSKNGTFLFLRDYMGYHSDRFVDYSLIIWGERGRPLALLPANRSGDGVISHGGLTYGGFVTDSAMKTPKMLELFEETASYLKEHSVRRLVYKTIPHIYHKAPSEEDRYALFLCGARVKRRAVLAVVDETQKITFQKRRLRGVETALKNNLSVRQSEDYESYWRLLTAHIIERYKTMPVHTLDEILLLRSRFPANIKLFVCSNVGGILAGVVVYESDKVAHVQYIASSEEGRALGALDLVFSHLIDDVYGCKPFFDFSTSDENNGFYLNRGLIDQKEGFGARAIVHDHYEIDLTSWETGRLLRVMG